jgi:hypothetical protein
MSGESNEDRLARKKRERQEYLRRQREAEAAEQEALDAYNAKEDAELEDFFRENFGAELDELQRDVHKGLGGDEGIDRILGEIKKQSKKGNSRKASRIAKQNKAKIRKAAAEVKKNKKGCVVVTLIGLAVGVTSLGAMVYGAAEALASIW